MPNLSQPWTSDPRVAALLAECVANPPEAERHVKTYVLTRDEWLTYEGPLADQLRAIHNEYGEAILAACDAADDYAAFSRFCDQPTVEQAIDEALWQAELDADRATVLAETIDRFNAAMAPHYAAYREAIAA